MKIMVCLKQVPHQDARLDIDASGTWIQEASIKFEINSYDTYALEEALRIKDAGEAEVGGEGGGGPREYILPVPAQSPKAICLQRNRIQQNPEMNVAWVAHCVAGSITRYDTFSGGPW